MQITDITISPSTGQELLPGFSEDFPCIRSEVVFGKYNGGHAPWHWHKAAELFYIAEGELEYHTPGGRILFQEGSGGFVNSGVLHMTRPNLKKGETRQLLHLFDPYFICDSSGGILARKYIFPVVSSGVEFLTFSRNDPAEADLLSLLEFSFSLEEGIFGYEFKLRSLISEMWLKILEKMPQPEKRADVSHVDGKLKRMMMFVHEHYGENIRTVDLAGAAFTSERECYRLFHDTLHCSPKEYITNYRLQIACERLRNGNETVTAVAGICGFGSSSRFGKLFSRTYECTPLQYRKHWQNMDINRHE